MWDFLSTFIKGSLTIIGAFVIAVLILFGALLATYAAGCIGLLLYCILGGVFALLLKK